MVTPSKERLDRALQQCPLYNPELSYRHLYGDLATHSTLEGRISNLITDGVPQDTLFFRDLKVLLAFEQVVLPSYGSSAVIKIASVGCSNGKEPYSLVLRNWAQRDRLSIDAFDVNPRSIEDAISGEYDIGTDEIFGELTKFQALIIPKPEDAYSLSEAKYLWDKRIRFTDEAKRKIRFSVINILEEQLPNQYNVVFFLNFLYHLSPKGREIALSNVNSGMKNGGWLICESIVPDVYADWASYLNRMSDIKDLGFEKQSIPHFKGLPHRYQRNYSQIYRKR